MQIVVATHNEGKLVEMRRILEEDLGERATEVELVSAGSLHLADPIETGMTFQENALLKARAVARETGLPAIADDSGLIVDVLGAAPGILSARWSGVHGHDRENNMLLLAQITDIPDAKRTARFRCAAVLVDPAGGEHVGMGEMPGRIIRGPRGEHGFGYDPIFEPDDQPNRTNPDGSVLTSAQLTADEKNAISHRGKAIKALMPAVDRMLDAVRRR